MDYTEREQLVLKLISGSTFVTIEGKVLELRPPTKIQRLRSTFLYQEAFQSARIEQILTEEEVFGCIIELGLWNQQKEEFLEKLKAELDEMKVTLYQSVFKSSGKRALKDGIKIAKANLASLESEKQQLNGYTCESIGRQAKEYYISLCEIYKNGALFIDPDSAVEGGVTAFDAILEARHDYRYTEENLRLLARTEPFRAIWNSSDKSSKDIFGVWAADLMQEQQMLLLWATTYDNIFKSPDCPIDEVVNDDDMLDGWLILENRKNVKDKEAKHGETKLSDKIKRAQEVYLMADTPNDAKRVYSLNEGLAANTVKTRMELIKQKGTVNEMEMPDTKLRLGMEIAKMEMGGK